MKKRPFLLIIALMLVTALIGSCSQKLPVPSSDEEGVLVIALEAVNRSNSAGFGYTYIFHTDPISPVELRVSPRESTEFIVFSHFPVGKYQLNGVSEIRTGKRYSRSERAMFGDTFEIKPKFVTILKRKLFVTKRSSSRNRWYQMREFFPLTDSEKKVLIEKLARLENADYWTFFE